MNISGPHKGTWGKIKRKVAKIRILQLTRNVGEVRGAVNKFPD